MSDASEYAGGLCKASQLTPKGVVRFRRMFEADRTGSSDDVAFIELFAGVGGGRQALDNVGQQLAYHGSTEILPACLCAGSKASVARAS